MQVKEMMHKGAEYVAPNAKLQVIAKKMRDYDIGSIPVCDSGKLIGFARLVTDKATFAWLCDVIVLPGKQGKGLGRALVQTFQKHPELQGLRRWLLGTKDAHGVYAPLGFTPLSAPDRFMEIRNPTPYGRASS